MNALTSEKGILTFWKSAQTLWKCNIDETIKFIIVRTQDIFWKWKSTMTKKTIFWNSMKEWFYKKKKSCYDFWPRKPILCRQKADSQFIMGKPVNSINSKPRPWDTRELPSCRRRLLPRPCRGWWCGSWGDGGSCQQETGDQPAQTWRRPSACSCRCPYLPFLQPFCLE